MQDASLQTDPLCPRRTAAGGTGWLRNGNPPGDLRLACRCGARTRAGHPCRQPAMRNGRCRLHGGKSTGPRTPLGREKSRLSQFRHGHRGRDFTAMRKEGMRIRRNLRALCVAMQARIAAQEDRALPRGVARWLESVSAKPKTRPDPEVLAACLEPLGEALATIAARAEKALSLADPSVDMGSGVGIQSQAPCAVRDDRRADAPRPIPWDERHMAKVVRDTLARVRPRFSQPVRTAAGWAPHPGLARAAA